MAETTNHTDRLNRAPRKENALTRIIERFLCFTAWASQALAAALYLTAMLQPGVWQSMFDKDRVTTFLVWFTAASLALLWMISIWQEKEVFYNRPAQRAWRKMGLIGHSGVLMVAAGAAAESEDRIGLWVSIGAVALLSTLVWLLWMESLSLPPEDQAVINAIIARETHKAFALRDVSEKERRRERLNTIVTSFGYELTNVDPESNTQQSTSTTSIRWKIPTGKHEPFVYFIRNGNRLKIGTTTDLKNRIRTLALRPENVVLLLIGGRQLERQLHSKFKNLRIGTTEWFVYDGQLVEYVDAERDRIAREETTK